ncbi:hypothetical protein PR202_gb11256 [Eleusine coracana subsp. coracana]|uniref:Uncharacterized protein n=1 Tax=Eleusine coracana subsp. coracana TaxID=191504 RepID=A0AAV5EM79_ELECO|nr:hypothetical protein PR202_gb11256 [Eleusine coracana subsp. coracana]
MPPLDRTHAAHTAAHRHQPAAACFAAHLAAPLAPHRKLRLPPAYGPVTWPATSPSIVSSMEVDLAAAASSNGNLEARRGLVDGPPWTATPSTDPGGILRSMMLMRR